MVRGFQLLCLATDSALLGSLLLACPAPPGEHGIGTETTTESTETTAAGEDPWLPTMPELGLSFSQVKQFDFSWTPSQRADYYQLLERLPDALDYSLLSDALPDTAISLTMPLHLRWGASYVVRACNGHGCTDSEPVRVVDSMVDAIGYFKASNTDAEDRFGYSVALSADGGTLAVGAYWEASGAAGIDGNQDDDSQPGAGAIYVFTYTDGVWTQQAYIKASNPDGGDFVEGYGFVDHGDEFGFALALSADGNVLAAGAPYEASAATGIDGDQEDDSLEGAGAVYVFERSANVWPQRAYLKASNPDTHDYFGASVALSGDGGTLAISAPNFESDGAVSVFVRSGDTWIQQTYVKVSNPIPETDLGTSIALSTDGDTLAVNAESWYFSGSGAAYVFTRESDVWSQQDYFISDEQDDLFGDAIAMSGDGRILAVGAPGADDGAGVVHVFTRDETWSMQARLSSTYSVSGDQFGASLALSADGRVVAVAAQKEAGLAVGINGDHTDTVFWWFDGAVYAFEHTGDTWQQRSYVKPSNTDPTDNQSSTETHFGKSIALSANGHTLAVGGSDEASAAVGVGGDQADHSSPEAGAVYLY